MFKRILSLVFLLTLISNANAGLRGRGTFVTPLTLTSLCNTNPPTIPPSFISAGEIITCTYTVLNNGPAKANSIIVTDNRVASVVCSLTTLIPGNSTNCTGQYTITAGDVSGGVAIAFNSIATATSTLAVIGVGTAIASVGFGSNPSLSISVSVNPTTYSAASENIDVTYTVTNTGNDSISSLTPAVGSVSATYSVGTLNYTISSFGGICNDIADDRAAFTAFRTAAIAAQGSPPKKVYLDLEGGTCYIAPVSGSTYTVKGVKNVEMINGTLTNHSSSVPTFFLGTDTLDSFRNPLICGKIDTVAKNATSVTLKIADLSKISGFIVGRYATVLGYDVQAGWDSAFGSPANPAFYDWVLVSAVDSMAGTITFTTTPLNYTYLDTWPAISIYQPGPATICPMPDDWNAIIVYNGVNIITTSTGMKNEGRNVTFKNLTVTSDYGFTPSMNETLTIENVTCTNCKPEFDKFVGTVNWIGGSVRQFGIQSMGSAKMLNVDGTTFTASTVGINGTPRNFNGNNITAATTQVGPNGYGRADSFACTNCNLGATSFSAAAVSDLGVHNKGIQNSYEMVLGVIKVPSNQYVSAISNNGSGKLRLTVPTTAGFFDGKWLSLYCLTFSSGLFFPSGCGGGGSPYITTIVNGTQIDLLDVNFSSMPAGTLVPQGPSSQGKGAISGGAPWRWAIPGTNMCWTAQSKCETPFYITDVTQDAVNVLIHTNLTSQTGFPGVALNPGTNTLGVQVHPSPSWTCTNCLGSQYVVDMQGMTPGAPMFSYYKRTFDESVANFPGTPKVWGTLVELKVTVNPAYTGADNPMTFAGFNVTTTYPTASTYTQGSNTFRVNTRIGSATPRVLTPSAATGIQVGDTGWTAAIGNIWFAGSGAPAGYNQIPDNVPPATSIITELTTNQGLATCVDGGTCP